MSEHGRRLKGSIKVFVGVPFLGIRGPAETHLPRALKSIASQRTTVQMTDPWVTGTASGQGETRYIVARKMNEIMDKGVKSGCTHIWLHDADCESPPTALEDLIRLNVDIASGVSPTHNDWNETTAAWELPGGGLKFYRRMDIEGKVMGELEVVATGGFCMLIKRRALLRYSKYHAPLRYHTVRALKAMYGPELQFFIDAQRMGLSVRLHGGVMCGHLPEYPLNYKGGEDTLHNKIRAIKWRRPIRWLIIVDVYDWAWDIASKQLLKALPNSIGRTVSLQDFKKVDPMQYDVVLIYPWGMHNVITRLSPMNTVVCMAGGEQLLMMASFKKLCGRFKFFGACNKVIQDRLKQELPDKTILHLSHGVDTQRFKPGPRANTVFTVGWAGSHERILKRLNLAREIAEKGGFNLDVAGFKQYPHSAMPGFYQRQDAFLVTSEKEAHPLVVYEAMATGLPVVTTNVGDVDRYIINGVNGFILPVNATLAAFVEVLNWLKNDPALRARIGEAARQTTLEMLSWAEVAKQYTPIIELMEKQ